VEPPGDEGAYVTGTVGDHPVQVVSDNDGFHGRQRGDYWYKWYSLSGIHVRLWRDEGYFGLLYLPTTDGLPSRWICLAGLEVEDADYLQWTATDLSRLDPCEGVDGEPLELRFRDTDPGTGSWGDEMIAWQRSGGACASDAGCEFYFASMRPFDRIVWLDAGEVSEDDRGHLDFPVSALVSASGLGARACGSEGTQDAILTELSIHALGALEACPGEPVDGELRGGAIGN
jgi:hypothetical protein